MSFSGIPFIVTDTETTGHQADDGRIIEIAAVKVVDGRIVDRYAQLINPGRSIPSRITRLTGITTGMVFDQPNVQAVLPSYLAFLGDGVLVAHNLSFDLGFINAELRRIGRPQLEVPTLCTLRLARRLLRGLRSKGLSGLAAFYNITVEGRHRALGDALATAEVLIRFLRRVTYEYGIESLEELLAFQFRTYGRPSPMSGARGALTEKLRLLPDRPGVYYMKDAQGRIIYVGKAKSLQSRVRSYFTSIEAHNARLRTMIDIVQDVVWEEMTSELEALIHESRQIKKLTPRFNQAQLRYKHRQFLRIDETAAFPRLTVSPILVDDGATYFGPLASRREAEMIVDLVERWYLVRPCTDTAFGAGQSCLYAEIGRCQAPCEGQVDAATYRKQVEQVRAFLAGQDASVIPFLDEAMRRASREMQFEDAARYRDLLELVTRLLDRQRCIAAPVMEHHAVVVSDEPGGGRRLVMAIRYGRLVRSMICATPLDLGELERIRAFVRSAFEEDAHRPESYLKPEIEEVRLLVHWLFTHQESIRQENWDEEQDAGLFTDRVVEAIAGFSTAVQG
ncbi:MAG: DEDD exonuclease domain-containing protein [Rhodothermales bacterium]